MWSEKIFAGVTATVTEEHARKTKAAIAVIQGIFCFRIIRAKVY
jgi:hypothetical protein